MHPASPTPLNGGLEAGTVFERFRALHVGGDPLVLVDCWDPASARVVAQAGARAFGPTSAGAAGSLGVADGGALGPDRALAVVRRVSAVDVPVTVDLEDAYAEDPVGITDTVAPALASGVAGVTIGLLAATRTGLSPQATTSSSTSDHLSMMSSCLLVARNTQVRAGVAT